MPVQERTFPDRFAILPSDVYRFGPPTRLGDRFQVVGQYFLPSGAAVYAVNDGLLAFDFSADPALGGFVLLESSGSGLVPQAVSENHAAMLALQGARMRLAAFTAACIFGLHAGRTHSAVRSALFPGLDEIFAWILLADHGFAVPAQDTQRLLQRLQRRPPQSAHIPTGHVEDGVELATRLIRSADQYVAADPVSMITMTYQAMILHHRQHAGASVALSALVAEAAVAELVYALGFVDETPARLSCVRPPTPMSRRRARNLGFEGASILLAGAGVFDAHLKRRLDALRRIRNALMHDVQDPSPSQSGDGLTVVRDLLHLCTEARELTLNTGWGYRF